MPDTYVIPRSHLYLVRRAILEEQSRIASGFYADPLMADKLEGDAIITIHDDVPGNHSTENSA